MSAKSAVTKRPSRKKAERTFPRPITVEEFDRRAEAGEDLNDYLDWEKAEVIEPEPEPLPVAFPASLMDGLNREATRVGVTPDALVKVWVAERLDALSAAKDP